MLSVFTVPHTEHFNNSVVLLLPVFGTLGFMFSVLFYTLNKMIALLYTWDFKLLAMFSFCLMIISIYFVTFFNQINFSASSL